MITKLSDFILENKMNHQNLTWYYVPDLTEFNEINDTDFYSWQDVAIELNCEVEDIKQTIQAKGLTSDRNFIIDED